MLPHPVFLDSARKQLDKPRANNLIIRIETDKAEFLQKQPRHVLMTIQY